MNSEEGQVYYVCILQFPCCTSTTVCSQNINKQIKFTAFSVGIPILNQRIIWKDDIEFVIEFPCLLGHPVHLTRLTSQKTKGETWHVFLCEFWIQIKRKLRTYFNRYFIKIKSKINSVLVHLYARCLIVSMFLTLFFFLAEWSRIKVKC